MPDTHLSVHRFPLGLAYAANQVNATVFRVGALASFAERQYVTFYDPDGGLMIGRRAWESADWQLVRQPIQGSRRDAHNASVLGISPDGFLHLSYNHHGAALHYRRSARPRDITAFGPEQPMTGSRETRVTYPQFVSTPGGTLLFFYRDGNHCDGRMCGNAFDPERGEWRIVRHPIVDGMGTCNPYWWRPAFGPDGSLHLAWCWRSPGGAETNHHLCYARSPDEGRTWQRSDGTAYALPITPHTAEIADPVPMHANLLNQCAGAVDTLGRPHFAHYHNDERGIPQYMHLWHDGAAWRRNTVSRRTTSFSLAGDGTLRLPISRPEIAITADNVVYLITRDAETGGGLRLYRAEPSDDYARWDAIDVLENDLGEWEPTYDAERFRRTGVLSLFLLRVEQGDHETVSDLPPQEASVLEIAGL